jgi:hypothetical protein
LKKFLVIAIPIVTLAIFLMVMFSGNYLKQPLGTDDNIPQAIEGIIKDIMNDKWDKVQEKTEKLESSWAKVVARVQFSVERDEINAFTSNMARLKGAILARDKSSALIELQDAYSHWNNLGK